MVVVAAASVLAVSAAGVAGGWSLQPRVWFDGRPVTGATPPPAEGSPSPPPVPTETSPLAPWIGLLLATLLALTLLAGLAYLARELWRRRPRRAVVVEVRPEAAPAGVLATEARLPALLRGAEAAAEILAEGGGVPRDLIVRCWLALEEAAEHSGAARRPSDTPTEFTVAVLRSTRVDPGSVDTLLRLYHRARFSAHPIADDEVRAARTAVVRLAATWRGFDTAMRHSAQVEP